MARTTITTALAQLDALTAYEREIVHENDGTNEEGEENAVLIRIEKTIGNIPALDTRNSATAARSISCRRPDRNGRNSIGRVQDYQIRRLLVYKTSCDIARLENRSPLQGPLHCFATCDNATFYPDGADVECIDRDDDPLCRILTATRTFDQLHLLDGQQK